MTDFYEVLESFAHIVKRAERKFRKFKGFRGTYDDLKRIIYNRG